MHTHSIRLCGREIDQPGHICAFFTSAAEAYDTLLPYIDDGIHRGDLVVNVVDAARLPAHRQHLANGGIPLDEQHVVLASSEETYLLDGHFDIDRMSDFVRSNLQAAARQGRRVRTAGWMDWLHREAPGTDRAIEYEARMNLLFPDFDATFMCVYDLSKLTGEMVVDIMATHPYVILDGQVRENSFYVPPETYLRELVAVRKRRARAAE